jgi:NitT/TauT family transport system ATP-binding protein
MISTARRLQRSHAVSANEPMSETTSTLAAWPSGVPRRSAIEARSLGKRYRSARGTDLVAIENVSFQVEEGEFVAVVGPSGCGKSTLLRIVAGLIPPTSGEVARVGRSVSRPDREIGIVFQSPVLLPWRTIRENVVLPLEFRGESRATAEKALALLALVGLDAFADRYPHELSGGMQQRAALARALVTDPSILLMDEPFGALDAMTREHMNLELLRLWTARRKTVLFITHSIAEAVFLSDRVLVMTSRPGTLAETITIDMPRPRTLSVLNTERAGTYMSRIRGLLNAQGALAG